MKFFKANDSLPNYDAPVLLVTADKKMFSGKLMTDEDGDYWVYDLPPSILGGSDEVNEMIVSWAYIE